MIYNKANFHKNTFCIFSEVDAAAISNLSPSYKSKSGSAYYFTAQGVYRLSNHWGRAAKCKWRLISGAASGNRTKLGYARWTDFHRDNDFEKLYYIKSDKATALISFEHIGATSSEPHFLRTAPQTVKRVRQIREFLKNDRVLDHYSVRNREEFKTKIVQLLIGSDQSLSVILKQLA